MSILEEVIRADGEYTQFREALGKQFRAGSDPKPLLVSGLCEGAADAFLVAGTKDTAGVPRCFSARKKRNVSARSDCSGGSGFARRSMRDVT